MRSYEIFMIFMIFMGYEMILAIFMGILWDPSRYH